MMFSNHDRPHLEPVRIAMEQFANVNSKTEGSLPCLGTLAVKPLDVQVVARAVVAASLDQSVSGVIDVPSIENLSTV
jgi:hypothetical protein